MNAEPGDDAVVPAPRRLRMNDPLVIIAVVLVVLAAGTAVFFGARWIKAGGDQNLSYSRDRDDALRAGEQAIENLNTVDYHNVPQSLALWVQSTTGGLNKEMTDDSKNNQVISTLQKAKSVSSAKILSGALTALNTHDGTATIITAVDVTVTPDGQKPADKRLRILGSLTKTNTGWLLSDVQPVPVQSPGQ